MDSLRLEGIGKDYTRGRIVVPVLKGISLSIKRGEMVAIMGASGSGKTTLVNLLGALDQPTEGRYWFDQEDVSRLSAKTRALLRNQAIGFVFQNFNLLPRLSALENVMLPLAYSAQNPSSSECSARARALLERVGLGARIDHEPAQLSGGEQQRVAIARALVNQCAVLIADEPTGNLDSHTGEEILALFQELNASDGITIILVTHDPTVAAHAHRVVRIRDGIVYEDSAPDPSAASRPPTSAAKKRTMSSGKSPKTTQIPPAKPRRGSHKRLALMRRRELRLLTRTTSMALRALNRNSLRSALTTLGIIIGVASLIAIGEIGKGSAKAIGQMLTKTGVDTVVVQAGAASRNGVSLGSGSVKTLTPEDAEAILHECPAVESLAPIINGRWQVVHGNKNWVPFYLQGTTPGLLRVRDWETLEEGEAFTDQDVTDASLVCLIGETLARELFEEESPLGQEVLVNDVPLKVIGVLSRKGANIIGEDEDDILLAPWTTVKYRISGSATTSDPASHFEAADSHNLLFGSRKRYPRTRVELYPTASPTQAVNMPKLERFSNVDAILVRAHATREIPIAMAQIGELLRERHHIGQDEEDDFSVRDFTEVIKAVQTTLALVAGLLLFVALISLAVGGIGIMNIMLVSVTERVREIGLRMALGANSNDILHQFLVEAVVLSVLGGAMGILVGQGVSALVHTFVGWATEPSWLVLSAAVSISITVGVVFGYYPAWKASRLNPIEALRFE
jgi:macrolide transport system ATP-binding/permease protein